MIKESKLAEIRALAAAGDSFSAAMSLADALATDVKADNPDWGRVGDKAVAVVNDAVLIVSIDEERFGRRVSRKVMVEVLAGKPDVFDITLGLVEDGSDGS